MNEYNIPKSVVDFMSLSDTSHPLAELGAVRMAGIEEDIKRKGITSEIIKRITRLEEAVRKLQAKG